MRKAVNNCVCCDLPCVNCGRRHEEVFICDNCEEEKDVLYLYDNKEICEGCLKAKLISEFIISNSMEEAIKNINKIYNNDVIVFKENSYYLDRDFYLDGDFSTPYNFSEIISEILSEITNVCIDDMINNLGVDVLKIEN